MEIDVIKNTMNGPVIRQSLIDDFKKAGVQPGITLLVHSSLSSIGWVCGGAFSVISALQEVIRPYGTIIMPTHSGDLSDPSGWRNPPVPESWWQTIREAMPPFDPELTPTRGVGVISECFRNCADVVRSSHPQVSFAAWGGDCLSFIQNHPLEDSLGTDSPLGKIYNNDGLVLLLGAGFEKNTSFHLSEWKGDFKGKKSVFCSSPITIDGHRKWKRYKDLDYNDSDFKLIGKDFLIKHKNQIKTGKVGNAETLLFSQKLCVDFAISWMARKRNANNYKVDS